jgi:hypothetical protein
MLCPGFGAGFSNPGMASLTFKDRSLSLRNGIFQILGSHNNQKTICCDIGAMQSYFVSFSLFSWWFQELFLTLPNQKTAYKCNCYQ